MKTESFFDPDRKLSPMAAVIFGALIIIADLLTPSQVLISIFFVLPVIVAGWFNGRRWAITLSIALPLSRFFIAVYIEPLWDVGYNIINAVARLVVLLIVSFITVKLSHSVKFLKKEVKVLEGMIPICANCKKIRDKNEDWQPLEKYITERSETQFSHGICPDCMKLLYGNYLGKS